MPGTKRNSTSFKPGHVWRPEAIAKRSATMKAAYRSGTLKHPWVGRKVPLEELAQMARTRRLLAIGHRYKKESRGRVYWQIMTPEGRRYEHRVVMEQHLGRKLQRSEHVHHKNGDGLDNRLENLEVMKEADHIRHHRVGNALPPEWIQKLRLPEGRWARKYECCVVCGTTKSSHASRGVCSKCNERRKREAKKAAAQ